MRAVDYQEEDLGDIPPLCWTIKRCVGFGAFEDEAVPRHQGWILPLPSAFWGERLCLLPFFDVLQPLPPQPAHPPRGDLYNLSQEHKLSSLACKA